MVAFFPVFFDITRVQAEKIFIRRKKYVKIQRLQPGGVN
jgi:hypothetical protein